MPVKLEDSLLRFRSIPCQMLMLLLLMLLLLLLPALLRVLLFRQNLPPRSLLTQQALPWSVSSAPPLGAPQNHTPPYTIHHLTPPQFFTPQSTQRHEHRSYAQLWRPTPRRTSLHISSMGVRRRSIVNGCARCSTCISCPSGVRMEATVHLTRGITETPTQPQLPF